MNEKFGEFTKFIMPLIRGPYPPRFNIETSHLIFGVLEKVGYEVFVSPYPSIVNNLFCDNTSGVLALDDYLGIEIKGKVFIGVSNDNIRLNIDGVEVLRMPWRGNFEDLANPDFDVYESLNEILMRLESLKC